MARFNFQKKCVECRIVYYGPGFCGKTTNLQVIHEKAPSGATGDLSSIATKDDRTLFFDFMPMELGKVAGLDLKFLMYTVPGQVYYNNTRKLVLQAVDGIIFVADSDKAGVGKMAENIQSLENLRENLLEQNRSLEDIPIILQYNKRDLPETYTVEELNEKLNTNNWETTEAVAVTGEGVFQTIKVLSRLMIDKLNISNTDNLSRMSNPSVNPGITTLTPGSDVEINLESIAPAPPPPPLPPAAPTKVVVNPTGTVNVNTMTQVDQKVPASITQEQPPPPPPAAMNYQAPPGHQSAPGSVGHEIIQALQSVVSGGGAGSPTLTELRGEYKPDEIIQAIQNLMKKEKSTEILDKFRMTTEEFDHLMKNYGAASEVKGFSQSKFITDYEKKK